MPDVKISIAGREYMVACNPGEEQRLTALGAMVNASADEAGGGTGSLNETRTLLFAALLLADKLHDVAPVMQDGRVNTQKDAAMAKSTDALESLADRLENLALRLEN